MEKEIELNILKIEKTIREFKINNELQEDKNIENKEKLNFEEELKWFNLDYSNKEYLLKNIKDYKQTHVCIMSNLKLWIPKFNNDKNFECIYNTMVNYLVDRTLKCYSTNDDKRYEFVIKIFVDNCNLKPSVKTYKEGKLIKKNLSNLENYLNNIDECELPKKYNLTIKVNKLNSKNNSLIRYADYYSGLISSTLKFLNNSKNSWDQNMKKLFDLIHKKINCSCHCTILDQCKIINKIHEMCVRHKIEYYEKNIKG